MVYVDRCIKTPIVACEEKRESNKQINQTRNVEAHLGRGMRNPFISSAALISNNSKKKNSMQITTPFQKQSLLITT